MTKSRYEGYKDGFKDGFREGLRAKSENELREELKRELEEEVRQELRDELIDEVKEELREELREECEAGCLKEYLDNFDLDDFEKGFIEGFVEEYPKGIREGKLKALRQIVQDGLVSISDAAKFVGTTEDELRRELEMAPEETSDATADDTSDEDVPAADASNKGSTSDEKTDGVVSDNEKTLDREAEEDFSFDLRPIEARARMIGVEEGSVRVLKQLVVDGVLTLADAAESVWSSIAEFEIKAVRTEERWEMEYESLWDMIEKKDELFSSHPEYEDIVEEAIAEWRESGLAEGASIVLTPLVAKGVLTEDEADRYVATLR